MAIASWTGAIVTHATADGRAKALIEAGDFSAAIRLLRPFAAKSRRTALLLGLCYSNQGNHAAAAKVLEESLRQHPDDPDLLKNLTVCYALNDNHAQAIAVAERVIEREPENVEMHDVLARTHGALGNFEKARHYGERALVLKDAKSMAECVPRPLPPEPAPPLSSNRFDNIIAYSLWGDKPYYVGNAIENARIAPHLFPAWTVRVYCDDTVPAAARKELMELGADVQAMPRPKKAYDGLFWRFQPMNEPIGRRFLVRDADSLLSVQERIAVDEWIASGRYFHVMRDYFTHTALIMAGMWGGCCGVLPPFSELRNSYQSNKITTGQVDQWFLGAVIWPLIKPSCLIHDSLFRVLGSIPFPGYGRLPPNRHVGLSLRARFTPPKGARKLKVNLAMPAGKKKG